jgi:hypothetical protein
MTIRPLQLIYISRELTETEEAHNYKYIKTGYCHIRDHRGQRLVDNNKISKNFWNKLLSYPITALGYDIEFKNELKDLPNPKFDRTDVIKALDFWIEHWVYQNKKDYILEGTVNKDFELTVRELIETREAVLKMPADTEFVRQKIRAPIKLIDSEQNDMIEFTENVLTGGNSSASTVDQFCYVVRKMTYKEYMKQNNPRVISGQNGILSGIIRIQMDRQQNIVGLFNSSVRESLINPEDFDTDNWRVALDDEHLGTIKVVDIRGHNIASDFRSEINAREFIQGVRDRFTTIR